MSRKQYETSFIVNAGLGHSYSATFTKAEKEVVDLQNKLNALNKTQSNISAYQRQQEAAGKTSSKLDLLQQEYNNMQREMKESETYSSSLANNMLKKQKQIDETKESIKKQNDALEEMREALREAGVNTENLTSESKRLGNELEEIKTDQEAAAEAASKHGRAASESFQAVQQALIATGAIAAVKELAENFKECINASVDFESAMAGVAKTSDFSKEELAEMGDRLQEMSTEMPVTAEELASIAETAGQLGIAKADLTEFTEVMANLGAATNLTSDEAATLLARFANVTGMDPDYYEKLGAVVVDLGNNFATTEAEIVSMGQRLSAAGTLAGMSEAEIMALSAAMSSVGIEAEAGGSAMSTTMATIEKAVAKGGEDVAEFAKIAGMSADEFKSTWETSAITALQAFIDGLGSLDEKGESAVLALDDLGLSAIRQSNMLKSLGLASDVLSDSVNRANIAWQEGTALTEEAGKRYATTESKMIMTKNAAHNLAATFGDQFTPELAEMCEAATDVMTVMSDFVEENPKVVKAATAFVGVIAAAAVGLTTYAAAARTVSAATVMIKAAFSSTPIGLIVKLSLTAAGVAAALAAVGTSAEDAVPSLADMTKESNAARESLKELSESYDTSIAKTDVAGKMAKEYIDRLKELESAGVDTVEEQKEYHSILEGLCRTVPELSSLINLNTDEIDGGTSALDRNTDAWIRNAKAKALENKLTALEEQRISLTVEKNQNSKALSQAYEDLREAEAAAGPSPSKFVTDEKELKELRNAQQTLSNYKQARQDDSSALAEVNSQIDAVLNMQKDLSGYAGGTNHATPGAHWVGEGGPEIVFFGGGEKVLSNGDTKKFIESDDYENRSSIVVAPVYNISGMDRQDDISKILDEHDKGLKKLIIDTIAEDNRDKTRRSFK